MREIKFRAWDLEFNEMLECVSVATTRENKWISMFSKNGLIYSIECDHVLMQYTGLKDKNGKEIYEGDVVKGKYFEYGKERRFIGKVIYCECGFKLHGLKKYSHLYKELNTNYEVIGNIYENKKMVEI